MAVVLFLQAAGGSLALALIVHFFTYYLFPGLPATIPRVRDEGKARFSFRTRWAYMTDCRRLYRETYEQVSDLPFNSLLTLSSIPKSGKHASSLFLV